MSHLTLRQKKFLAAIPVSWQRPLAETCADQKTDNLIEYLQIRECASDKKIYPAKKDIFAAMRAVDFDKVKIVIVGQDPYHGPGQAHGLSFSVPNGVALPPSLKNIFKELKNDLGIEAGEVGDLSSWAQQGVLLLNSILTVEESTPAAHAGQGWEFFTDAILARILRLGRPVVFMLWGAYAQKKLQNLNDDIDHTKHLILKAAHPSPFSVKGFLGCKHFSKANKFLVEHGEKEINWQL